MNTILLHIPHSSERLPKRFWQNILLPKDEILVFNRAMTDLYTAKLFGKNHYKKVIFNYSRIFCDVEKFVDDKKEIMSRFGMGVVYTKTNLGRQFKNVAPEYKKIVLEKFYYPYHEKLDKIALRCVKKHQTILVDCHSFSKEIIMFDDKKQNLPDICVGFNGKSDGLVDFVVGCFENMGYVVAKNYPYDSSLIPNALIERPNKNFHSVMIEVNKNLYLSDRKSFKKLQKDINLLLKRLENFELK